MTKIEQMFRLIVILREAYRNNPGPKALPDEILVGTLLWGDLQCLSDFTVSHGVGEIKGIPVRPSRDIHSQSWALVYDAR